MKLNFTTRFIFLLFSFITVSTSAFAQPNGCGCTNCPQYMPDNFTGDFDLNVQGATNNDLSDPSQGICGVNLEFDHQYLGDLAITLNSPDGQSIILVGPVGFHGDTDLSTWDVTFVPCSESANPDPGQNAVWNSETMPVVDYDWVGSYYPSSGCLEEFNSGSVNGTWSLTVNDAQAVDVGTFLDFEIIFCDDSGINCNSNPCGVFADLEYESIFCSGEIITIDASGSFGATSYTWGTEDGEFLNPPNGPIVEVVSGGTYTVTVSQGSNPACNEVATAILTEIPQVPEVMISQDVPFGCESTEVTLMGETGEFDQLFYNWYAGNEASIDFENSNPLSTDPNLVITEPGEYTLIIVNIDQACAGAGSYVVVDETDFPEITSLTSGDIDCNNSVQELELEVNENFLNYAWSGPDGFNSFMEDPEVDAGGLYSVTVTNSSGCTATAEVNVIENSDQPDIEITPSNQIDCNNSSSVLFTSSATDDLVYEWTGPNGYTSDEASPTINEGGEYDLIVTAPNGCTNMTATTITASDLPTATISTPTVLTCNNPTTSLTGSSNYSDANFTWLGPNGFTESGATISNLSDAGEYTLIVSTNDGCVQEANVMVDENTGSPDISTSASDDLDCVTTQVQLSGSTTTAGNNTFIWTGPSGFNANTDITDITIGGEYTLTITGENGCQSTQSITVNQAVDVPMANATGNTIDCNNTIVSISGSSPTTDVVYSWTGPNGFTSSSENPDNIIADGTYNLVVTNDNGCTSTAEAIVSIDTISPILSLNAPQGELIGCTLNSVSLEGSSANNSDILIWSYNSTALSGTTIDADQSGEYTLLGMGANGCSSLSSITINEDFTLPQNIATTSTTINCFGNQNIAVSSTTPDVTYVWTGPNGFTSSEAAPMVTESGNYDVVITAPNSCQETASLSVDSDLGEPDISTTGNMLDCSAEPVAITGASTTDNVTYSWTGPGGFTSTEQNPMVNAAGTYTLSVVGSNGCESTMNAIVELDANAPNAAATSVGTDVVLNCNTPEVTIMGSSSTANTTIMWEFPDGSTSTDPMPNVTTAGTYNLIVTATNGCTSQSFVNIADDYAVPQEVVFDAGIIYCDPDETQIMANSATLGVNYEWTGPNGFTSAFQNPMVSESGTYTGIVTAPNGCDTTVTIEVMSDVSTASLSLDADIITCSNTEVNIQTTSDQTDMTYEWTGPNGFTATDANPNVDTEGAYTVIATSSINACTSEATYTVLADNDNPDIDIQGANINCNQDMATLTAISSNTDLTYEWSDSNGTLATDDNIEVGASDTYSVLVTASNGCTETASFEVQEDFVAPDITAEGGTINCSSPSIQISSSSLTQGVLYSWTGPNGFTSDVQNPDVDSEGTYTLELLAPNGCTETTTVNVGLDIIAPMLAADADQITCTEPSVSLDGSSSTPAGDSIIYQWYYEGTTIGNEEINPSTNIAGMYTLVGTNQNNQCTDSLELEVLASNDLPTAIAGTDQTITCTTTSVTFDGSASTGLGNLSYVWTNEAGQEVSQEATATVDYGGSLTLTVTDTDNGCQNTALTTALVNNAPPIPSIDPVNIITCTQETVEINGASSTTQTTGTVLFEWTDANNTIVSTTDIFSVANAGDYNLFITDSENGCTATQTITVEQDESVPMAFVQTPEILNCINEQIILDGSESSSGGVYTYSWTDSNNGIILDELTTTPTVNEPGVYTLTVFNEDNGCDQLFTVEVFEDITLPTVSTNVDDILDCTIEEVQIDGLGSSEGDQYSYTWSGNNLNNTALSTNVSDAGVYTLTVLNEENGCSAQASITVESNDNIITDAEVVVEDEQCVGDNNGLMVVSAVEGGTAPYVYAFENDMFGTSNQMNNLSPGTYTTTIQDAAGCLFVDTVQVLAATPVQVELGEDLVVELGDSILLEVQSNTFIDSLIWSNPSIHGMNPVYSPTSSGVLELVAMDENGCMATDQIIIEVERNRPVFIPTAFSPNNDTVNDVFMIYSGNAVASIKSFRVFDRWGSLLFERNDIQANNPDDGWDGYFRNNLMKPGVFVYYAEIEFIDGIVELFKGDVSLMR